MRKNIGYGLKNMKLPADEIRKKVDWAIDILGLEEYRYRKPKNLSGGQRQRVALGRAIVKNQKLFLMDEPLSNLDAKLRVSMRTEISKTAPGAGSNHHLCHARPGGGHDHGGPDRHHERGRDPAGGQAHGTLRSPGSTSLWLDLSVPRR